MGKKSKRQAARATQAAVEKKQQVNEEEREERIIEERIIRGLQVCLPEMSDATGAKVMVELGREASRGRENTYDAIVKTIIEAGHRD